MNNVLVYSRQTNAGVYKLLLDSPTDKRNSVEYMYYT